MTFMPATLGRGLSLGPADTPFCPEDGNGFGVSIDPTDWTFFRYVRAHPKVFRNIVQQVRRRHSSIVIKPRDHQLLKQAKKKELVPLLAEKTEAITGMPLRQGFHWYTTDKPFWYLQPSLLNPIGWTALAAAPAMISSIAAESFGEWGLIAGAGFILFAKLFNSIPLFGNSGNYNPEELRILVSKSVKPAHFPFIMAHEMAHHFQMTSATLSRFRADTFYYKPEGYKCFIEGSADAVGLRVVTELSEVFGMLPVKHTLKWISDQLNGAERIFKSTDVLKDRNFTYAVGYSAFAIAEEIHGPTLIPRVFSGDFSFLKEGLSDWKARRGILRNNEEAALPL